MPARKIQSACGICGTCIFKAIQTKQIIKLLQKLLEVQMINQNVTGIALTKHLLLLCVSDILSACLNDSWSAALGVNYVVFSPSLLPWRDNVTVNFNQYLIKHGAKTAHFLL